MGVLATPTVTAGCAEPVTAHTATNPGASFDKYRTFSLGPVEGPPRGYQTSGRSADIDRRLQPILAAGLVQRGYVQASDPAKADFFIMFGSGRRVVSERETSAVAQAWSPDDENADFVRGSLVIDAFDTTTRGRVWHGVARADLDPGRMDDALLTRAISDMFASFPKAKIASP
jgi:hypothetical protein